MVTGVYPNQPSISLLLMRSVAAKLSQAIEAKSSASVRAYSWVHSLVRNVLILAAFVVWTIAAFSVTFVVGMVVAGISCTILSWLMKGPTVRETSAPINTRR